MPQACLHKRVAVPAEFVHRLPPQLDPLDAVGLEPLAVAVHSLRVGNVKEGDPVAVIGCGNQGLLLIQLAVAKGARVLAADVQREPLSTARALGALDTLHIGADAPPDTGDWSPSVVFEAAALRIGRGGGYAHGCARWIGHRRRAGGPARVRRPPTPCASRPAPDRQLDLRPPAGLPVRHRPRRAGADPSGHARPGIAELSQAADALSRIVRAEAGKTVFNMRGVREHSRATLDSHRFAQRHAGRKATRHRRRPFQCDRAVRERPDQLQRQAARGARTRRGPGAIDRSVSAVSRFRGRCGRGLPAQPDGAERNSTRWPSSGRR